MRLLKRVMSMVLVVALLIGYIPTRVHAATDKTLDVAEIYASECGDFEEEGWSKDSDSSVTLKAGYSFTITNSTGATSSCHFYNYGTITSADNIVVTNYGYIGGGSYQAAVNNHGTIAGGSYDGEVENHSGASITAGAFNGTVCNSGTITGGTFPSVVSNNGTISGGVFTDICNEASGVVAGGTLNGTVENSGIFRYNGQITRGENFALTGEGTLECTDHEWDENSNCVMCGIPCPHSAVSGSPCACGTVLAAKVDQQGYVDIDAALAGWVSGTTLTLLRDVTVSETFAVGGRELTLDLNGHTWTGSGAAITVDSGSLTVSGGKIVGSPALINQGGTAVLNNVAMNHLVIGSTTTVNGGTFTEKVELASGEAVFTATGSPDFGVGIDMMASSKMNLQNLTNIGSLTVRVGEFEYDVSNLILPQCYQFTESGTFVKVHNFGNDGVCTACGASCDHEFDSSTGACAVCAYKCLHDAVTGDSCVCGYALAAKIGNQGYATFQEAAKKWRSGNTLTLLNDAAFSETITLASVGIYTLELNGRTLECNADDGFVVNNSSATLNIQDSSEEQNGRINFSKSLFSIVDVQKGTLNINSGTLYLSGSSDFGTVRCQPGAVVNLNGGWVYCQRYSAFYMNGGTLNITGGISDGTICTKKVTTGGNELANIKITGGTVKRTIYAFDNQNRIKIGPNAVIEAKFVVFPGALIDLSTAKNVEGIQVANQTNQYYGYTAQDVSSSVIEMPYTCYKLVLNGEVLTAIPAGKTATIQANHRYSTNGYCSACSAACPHDFDSSTGKCKICSYTCSPHTYAEGKCSRCGKVCTHSTNYNRYTYQISTTDTNKHKRIYVCCGFWDEEEHSTKSSADRNEATCSEYKYCSKCQSEYGELNAKIHAADCVPVGRDLGDGTHLANYSRCSVSAIEAHTSAYIVSEDKLKLTACCGVCGVETGFVSIEAVNGVYNEIAGKCNITMSGSLSSNATVLYYYNENNASVTGNALKVPGTYLAKLRVTCGGNYYYLETNFIVEKADPLIKIPEANNWTYDAGNHYLIVKDGSSLIKGGSLEFRVGENGTWRNAASYDYPKERNAGVYEVYYRVLGNNYYKDVPITGPIVVTVSQAPYPLLQAPSAVKNLKFTNAPQKLVTGGNAQGATIMYRLGEDGEYSEEVPVATNAGTYYVYYMVKSNNSNYCDAYFEDTPIEVTIGACRHKGGTATCVDLKICTTCGESYGEVDLNNHVDGCVPVRYSQEATQDPLAWHTEFYSLCGGTAEGMHEFDPQTSICIRCEASCVHMDGGLDGICDRCESPDLTVYTEETIYREEVNTYSVVRKFYKDLDSAVAEYDYTKEELYVYYETTLCTQLTINGRVYLNAEVIPQGDAAINVINDLYINYQVPDVTSKSIPSFISGGQVYFKGGRTYRYIGGGGTRNWACASQHYYKGATCVDHATCFYCNMVMLGYDYNRHVEGCEFIKCVPSDNGKQHILYYSKCSPEGRAEGHYSSNDTCLTESTCDRCQETYMGLQHRNENYKCLDCGKDLVAIINDSSYYASMAEAVMYADNFDVITALKDIDEDFVVPVNTYLSGVHYSINVVPFTFSGDIEVYGLVRSGIFTGRVDLYDRISSGTYYNDVYIHEGANISCGVYHGNVYNSGKLYGGEIYGTLINEGEVINIVDDANSFRLWTNFVLDNRGQVTCDDHIFGKDGLCRLCNGVCDHPNYETAADGNSIVIWCSVCHQTKLTFTLVIPTGVEYGDVTEGPHYIQTGTNPGEEPVLTIAGRTDFIPVNVGNYQVKLSYGGVQIFGTYTITKPVAKYIAPQPKELTYSGASQQLITAGSTNHGYMLYSLTEDAGFTTSIPVATNTGTYRVWFYAAADSNHINSPKDYVDVVISKAELTVKANDHTITYGDAPADAGVVYDGLRGNDQASVLKGELTYEHTYSRFGNIGTYDITPSGLSADNYEIKFVAGKLTVNAKAATVTAHALIKTYGEDDPKLTYDTEGVLEGDTLLGALTRDAGSDVGTYTIRKGTLGDGGNYDITFIGAELTIVAKPITADDVTLVGSLVYNAMEQKQEIAVTDGVTYDVSGNKGINAGEYEMTVTGKGNYIGEITVKWGIEKAPAAVTLAPIARNAEYVGAALPLIYGGYGENGLIKYSLTEDGAYDTQLPTATEAGEYTIWYKVFGYTNYADTEAASVTVTISKAPAAVVEPVAKKLTYNADAQQLITAGSSNHGIYYYRLGETGTYSTEICTATEAGTYEVYYYLQADANHLDTAEEMIVVTIDRLDLTDKNPQITLTEEMTFNGQIQTMGVTVKLNNMDVTFDISGNAETDAGTYTLTITCNGNFEGVFNTEWNIAKKELMVTAKDQTILYNTSVSTTEFETAGLIDGHDIAVTMTPSTENVTRNGTVTPGDAVITDGDVDFTDSYQITYVPGALVIEPDTSEIDELTVDNVTTDDKEDLKFVQKMMDEADREGIDEDTKKKWDEIAEKCKELLDKIDEIETENDRIVQAVDSFDPDSITSYDEEAIKNLLEDIDNQLDNPQLTEDERENLESQKEKCEELMERIWETEDILDRLEKDMEDLDIETVNANDKEDLEKIIEDAQELLDSNNLTDEERKNLEQLKQDAQYMIDMIDSEADAMKKIDEKLASIKEDNVDLDELPELEQLAEDIEKLLDTKNLTEEQRAKLEEQLDEVNEEIKILNKKIDNMIYEVITLVEGVDPDNITPDDREDLKRAVKLAEELLELETLSDYERMKLAETKARAEELLEIILEAEKILTSGDVAKVKNVTLENAALADKDKLLEAKKDLERVLKDFDAYYSNEEKQEIRKELDRINAILQMLERVEEVCESISALPETVQPNDESAAEKILAAKKAYDALSDYEKSLVDEVYKIKLERLLAALTDYKITDGDKAEWFADSGKDLEFTMNGPFSKFVGIMVDGQMLDAQYYEVKDGGDVVVLKESFLKTLSEGEHQLTFAYTDGEAGGSFNVNAAAGMFANMNPYVVVGGLTVVCIAGFIILLLMRKKRKEEQ